MEDTRALRFEKVIIKVVRDVVSWRDCVTDYFNVKL